MIIEKTLIGIDFVNNGRTATLRANQNDEWDVTLYDDRGSFPELQDAVSWAMAHVGGQVLSVHYDHNWKVALCLVEVEERDAVLGNYTAKFSDGTHVPFHCKDQRASVSVAKAIGQVLVDNCLQQDEVDLFRNGFGYAYDHNIQETVMLDMEWLDMQGALATG